MKVLAIGSIVKELTPAQRDEIMPHEVPATLKLYLDGKIEQYWFRQDKPGVVFLMSSGSVDEVKATLDTLPLVEADILAFDLLAVGPLAPLGLLLQGK
ncbi:hypothetical protein [Paraburkholderia sp. J7]|uniref:hypothetical protein n=1 Tax=Paraburkholderia sp. J7 TaxID=2805438 RepID=UPI002AB7D612|nr:hypothetical protein [Paraburkholderia sp. J7]